MSNYTTRSGTTYHFRFFIPEPFQSILGQKVIKMSLKTGRKRLAIRMARTLASATRKYLQTLPEEDMKPADKEQLRNRLKLFLKTELEKDDLLRAMPVPFPDEDKAIQGLIDKHMSDLKGPMDEVTKKIFKLFMDKYKIQIQEDTIEYHVAGREFCKTLVELYRVILMRIEGDFVGEREYMEKLFPVGISEDHQLTRALQEEQESVCKEAQRFVREAKVTDSTKQKYSFTLDEFTQITGDINFSDLSHPVLRKYVSILKKLPKNYTKHHPNMSPLEVAQKEHENLITPRTINDKIGVVGRFFKWAIGQGFMTSNFAEGKRVPGGKPQKSTHEVYTLDDLRKMFNAPQYVEDKHRSPYQFWMIPLALFTGARQSELAQLRCDDLYETDGIWCIKIIPNEDDISSSVKTENALRTIPLHPVLTDVLNFPAFVKGVYQKGHDRIFPEIRPRQGKYGKPVSQWFNDRFKRSLDLIPPRKGFKKDFHSFRNTFINAAKQARVDTRMIEETVGHASENKSLRPSMSGDFYPGNYEEAIRYEDLMLKVEFDVDLKHLASSKFAG